MKYENKIKRFLRGVGLISLFSLVILAYSPSPALATHASAENLIFAVNNIATSIPPQEILTINPFTGEVRQTGYGALFPTVAVGRAPDGRLYYIGSGSTNQPVGYWDPKTHESVQIGTDAGLNGLVPRATFRADGTLIAGTSGASGGLYSINLTTGAGTLMGLLTGDCAGKIGGDIAFDKNGTLYLFPGANNLACTVDQSTFVSTAISNYLFPGAFGIAFGAEVAAGRLYVGQINNGTIWIYNPELNTATTSTSTSISTGDLASTPNYADLGITVTPIGSSIAPGGTGAYQVTVTNSGPNASNCPYLPDNGPAPVVPGARVSCFSVTQTLPAGQTFVSSGGSGDWNSCTAVGQTVTCVSNVTTLINTVSLTPLTINFSLDATVPAVGASVVTSVTIISAYAADTSLTATFDDNVTNNTDTISLTGANMCVAPTPVINTLTVIKNGAGTGTVTSSPTGINCGLDCTEAYATSPLVTLTATSTAGSTFAGWSGSGCSGVGFCVVTMDMTKNVTATFDPLLTVVLSGSGSVSSSPAGITCGADCTETYTSGTVVTLTATPATGQVFSGWTGACSGSLIKCFVTMDAAKSVTATFIPTSTRAVEIDAGIYHTCAVLQSGSIKCWGRNNYGQTGNGNVITPQATPVTVIGITTAVNVASGQSHTCALLNNGTIQCWGRNDYGQFGNGATATAVAHAPGAVVSNITGLTASTTAVNITIGAAENTGAGSAGVNRAAHTCALMANGTVKCWGSNNLGQLGDGSTTQRTTPVNVSGIDGLTPATTAVSVEAAGPDVSPEFDGSYTCAVMQDSSMKCWGGNSYGQIGATPTPSGTATVAFTSTPVTVSGLTPGVSAVGLKHEVTCVILTGGTVKCMGRNQNGETGSTPNGTNPNITSNPTPNLVGGTGTSPTKIATGGHFGCIILAAGTAQCWGKNSGGTLGNNSLTDSVTAVNVLGTAGTAGTTLSNITHITAGSGHVCAITSDNGGVKCWGLKDYGQIGDGTTSTSVYQQFPKAVLTIP